MKGIKIEVIGNIAKNIERPEAATTGTAPTPSVWQRVLSALGNLNYLKTTANENLVEAVNEVYSNPSRITDCAYIRVEEVLV